MAEKYDLIIIGGGPGGYRAALKAAELGLKSALIEKEKLGGVCVNHGCIPTKALLHVSNMFSHFKDCDEFGISADCISFDFGKMQNYKKRSVKEYRNGILELFRKNNITWINGTATIRRGKTIEVNSVSGKDYYQAENIIIATGARPDIPDIPGSKLNGVLTSDRLLAADTWNFDCLTIIGGGVIGVEFATIFNSLGSEVTIIEKDQHLLGTMDTEVSEALETGLRNKGIKIRCNADVTGITEDDGLVCHVVEGSREYTVKSGQIMVAAGRKPYMEGLTGEDVKFSMDGGRLKVDSEFMTSEPGIYAVGDVIAGKQLAHVAAAEGIYVVEKIAGVKHSIRLNVVPNGMFVSIPIVPSCIYTEPEIASVGITEEAARKHKMKVYCGKYNMNGNGKSIIARQEHGFIRLIFEKYSDTIVGAQMVCPRATDMIGEMATAIANGLTAKQLSLAMRAHPTYSEGISAAIGDAMKKGDAENEDSGI